ncbi:signal transduction histidine kinase [Actinoplanes lutulentus]|uniref:sensor histidine kinase n=1 Tax=Actinoplanes lutulentus TaxID=1287878 RepID=UPI000DBAA7CD|nr:histidine kinase [Actinoplanes lutulentus]MBB2949166.1 signal transduction histidine kinase [Actinoplanes lutulentus]
MIVAGTRSGPLRRFIVGHPYLADLGLALVLTGLPIAGYFAGTTKDAGQPLTGPLALGVFAAFVAITLRSRWPWQVLVASSAAMIWYTAVDGERHPLLIVAAAVAAYTTALSMSRRRGLVVVVGCGLGLYLGDLITYQSASIVPLLTFIAMATAFGDATRNRRAYLAEVEERARRAELTREEEAQRRVIQERLRIARELHDVVAHHIAVINVQAAAASHLVDKRPDQVRPALNHIRHAGDTVLKELGSIVGVLRQSDDPDSAEPTRGLARLPELLEAMAAAGLRVEHHRAGDERDLPAMVDLAAYRIVQEALTNAHKHGTGEASLTVTYTAQAIGIEVENIVATGHDGGGSGYGIVGMRERAAAADGTFQTCTEPDGRFTVRALLPAPIEEPK